MDPFDDGRPGEPEAAPAPPLPGPPPGMHHPLRSRMSSSASDAATTVGAAGLRAAARRGVHTAQRRGTRRLGLDGAARTMTRHGLRTGFGAGLVMGTALSRAPLGKAKAPATACTVVACGCMPGCGCASTIFLGFFLVLFGMLFGVLGAVPETVLLETCYDSGGAAPHCEDIGPDIVVTVSSEDITSPEGEERIRAYQDLERAYGIPWFYLMAWEKVASDFGAADFSRQDVAYPGEGIVSLAIEQAIARDSPDHDEFKDTSEEERARIEAEARGGVLDDIDRLSSSERGGSYGPLLVTSADLATYGTFIEPPEGIDCPAGYGGECEGGRALNPWNRFDAGQIVARRLLTSFREEAADGHIEVPAQTNSEEAREVELIGRLIGSLAVFEGARETQDELAGQLERAGEYTLDGVIGYRCVDGFSDDVMQCGPGKADRPSTWPGADQGWFGSGVGASRYAPDLELFGELEEEYTSRLAGKPIEPATRLYLCQRLMSARILGVLAWDEGQKSPFEGDADQLTELAGRCLETFPSAIATYELPADVEIPENDELYGDAGLVPAFRAVLEQGFGDGPIYRSSLIEGGAEPTEEVLDEQQLADVMTVLLSTSGAWGGDERAFFDTGAYDARGGEARSVRINAYARAIERYARAIYLAWVAEMRAAQADTSPEAMAQALDIAWWDPAVAAEVDRAASVKELAQLSRETLLGTLIADEAIWDADPAGFAGGCRPWGTGSSLTGKLDGGKKTATTDDEALEGEREPYALQRFAALLDIHEDRDIAGWKHWPVPEVAGLDRKDWSVVAREHGLDPLLLVAVAQATTRADPAFDEDGRMGLLGLTYLDVEPWIDDPDDPLDPADPRDNLWMGAADLAAALDRNSTLKVALAAAWAGQSAVDSARSAYARLDEDVRVMVDRISREYTATARLYKEAAAKGSAEDVGAGIGDGGIGGCWRFGEGSAVRYEPLEGARATDEAEGIAMNYCLPFMADCGSARVQLVDAKGEGIGESVVLPVVEYLDGDIGLAVGAGDLSGIEGGSSGGGRVVDSCAKPYWDSRTQPPPAIRVGVTEQYNDIDATSVKRIETVPFEEYVKRVMYTEWPGYLAGNGPYGGNGDAGIKAGAVAVKQYGWYWTTQQPRYKLGNKCFDVYDNIRDQAYKQPSHVTRPKAEQQLTDRAVEQTWDWIIYRRKAGGGKEFVLPFYISGTSYVCNSVPGGYQQGFRLFEEGVTDCTRKGWSATQILSAYYSPSAARQAFVATGDGTEVTETDSAPIEGGSLIATDDWTLAALRPGAWDSLIEASGLAGDERPGRDDEIDVRISLIPPESGTSALSAWQGVSPRPGEVRRWPAAVSGAVLGEAPGATFHDRDAGVRLVADALRQNITEPPPQPEDDEDDAKGDAKDPKATAIPFSGSTTDNPCARGASRSTEGCPDELAPELAPVTFGSAELDLHATRADVRLTRLSLPLSGTSTALRLVLGDCDDDTAPAQQLTGFITRAGQSTIDGLDLPYASDGLSGGDEYALTIYDLTMLDDLRTTSDTPHLCLTQVARPSNGRTWPGAVLEIPLRRGGGDGKVGFLELLTSWTSWATRQDLTCDIEDAPRLVSDPTNDEQVLATPWCQYLDRIHRGIRDVRARAALGLGDGGSGIGPCQGAGKISVGGQSLQMSEFCLVWPIEGQPNLFAGLEHRDWAPGTLRLAATLPNGQSYAMHAGIDMCPGVGCSGKPLRAAISGWLFIDPKGGEITASYDTSHIDIWNPDTGLIARYVHVQPTRSGPNPSGANDGGYYAELSPAIYRRFKDPTQTRKLVFRSEYWDKGQTLTAVRVSAGEIISTIGDHMGQFGTGPHLHFEILVGKRGQDVGAGQPIIGMPLSFGSMSRGLGHFCDGGMRYPWGDSGKANAAIRARTMICGFNIQTMHLDPLAVLPEQPMTMNNSYCFGNAPGCYPDYRPTKGHPERADLEVARGGR